MLPVLYAEIDDHLVAAMFGEQPSGVGELVIEEEENMEETGEGTHTCSHTAHLPHTDHMHLLWTLCHGLCNTVYATIVINTVQVAIFNIIITDVRI